jgi:tol-pal system protein YbgF
MTAPFRLIFRSNPRFSRFALPLALAAIMAVTAGLSLGPPARAQDAELESLLQRIERLQRDMNTLQRYVFKGGPAPAADAVAGTTAGAGGMTTTAAARIDLRLSQFEAQLRTLTGQVEEAVYRSHQINERLERLAAETDLRLRQLEQGVMPPTAMQGAPAGQMAPGAAGGGQAGFASQPQVLGTIRQSDLAAMQGEPVTPGTAVAQQDTSLAAAQPGSQAAAAGYTLVGATPQEQYKHAFGLLSQANYGEAELALSSFVDQHPNDPLAGNAKYWLGETFYVRQDYQQAAVTFAEAYQAYPDSAKAPDNLLKLGMSLSALGSQNDACGTFAELLKRYPRRTTCSSWACRCPRSAARTTPAAPLRSCSNAIPRPPPPSCSAPIKSANGCPARDRRPGGADRWGGVRRPDGAARPLRGQSSDRRRGFWRRR